MKIEKYVNDEGEFRCFGFSNAFFHKSDVKDFVESLPGSKITFFTKAFGAEDFCVFTYNWENFTVSEPYGDNSFYDILCENPDTEPLKDIYERFCNTAKLGKTEKSNKLGLAILVIAIVSVAVILSAVSS